MKFSEFLENQTANDIAAAFAGMGKGVGENAQNKQLEYAKRILAGESPDVVLQGIKKNGAFWNLVMQKVQELQGQGQTQPQSPAMPQTQPPAMPQISVSAIENRLGIRNGTLDLRPSRDGQFIFVRNRITGKSISAKPVPEEIEKAARAVVGIIN